MNFLVLGGKAATTLQMRSRPSSIEIEISWVAPDREPAYELVDESGRGWTARTIFAFITAGRRQRAEARRQGRARPSQGFGLRRRNSGPPGRRAGGDRVNRRSCGSGRSSLAATWARRTVCRRAGPGWRWDEYQRPISRGGAARGAISAARFVRWIGILAIAAAPGASAESYLVDRDRGDDGRPARGSYRIRMNNARRAAVYVMFAGLIMNAIALRRAASRQTPAGRPAPRIGSSRTARPRSDIRLLGWPYSNARRLVADATATQHPQPR